MIGKLKPLVLSGSTCLRRALLLVGLVAVGGLGVAPWLCEAASEPAQQPSVEPPEAPKPQLFEAYGSLPMSFEANRGQTDPQVRFLSRGSGYTLFLSSSEAVLVLQKSEEESSAASPRPLRMADSA